MPSIYPNGVGGVLGLGFATERPLYTSALVYYVSSVQGDAGNNGLDRNHPLATLQQAVTAANSVSQTVIVLLEDHREEIGAAITDLDFSVRLIGEGLVNGRPSVELTLAAGSFDMFPNASGFGQSLIENIRFRPPGNAAAPGSTTGSYIDSNQDDVELVGCDFELDGNNDVSGIIMQATANAWRFVNCRFMSVETSAAAANRPRPAVEVSGAITTLTMESCIFDGGLSGFQNATGVPVAFDATAAAITDMRVRALSLLRGADFRVASGTTGYIRGVGFTGSPQIVWPD
jgi:hypothetical protein